jgi:hypothetical protein
MHVVFVSVQSWQTYQKCSALDEVTLSKIVDTVLNEESYSSSDKSDVSRDDTALADSEEDYEIDNAVKIMPANMLKCHKGNTLVKGSGQKIKTRP